MEGEFAEAIHGCETLANQADEIRRSLEAGRVEEAADKLQLLAQMSDRIIEVVEQAVHPEMMVQIQTSALIDRARGLGLSYLDILRIYRSEVDKRT